jgi:hypothetical protein
MPKSNAKVFQEEADIVRSILGVGCTWSDRHKTVITRKYILKDPTQIPELLAKLEVALAGRNVTVRQTYADNFTFSCHCISVVIRK